MSVTMMKQAKLFLAALAFGGVMAAGAQADPQDAAHGYWLTQNGKAIVLMESCGSETCGRMVWIDKPLDSAGKLKLDVNNSDDAKRKRAICGLPLVGGMKQARAGSWKDGWIYNPRDGETYGVEVEVVSSTELKVRGYAGLRLFGKNQIWTRVDGDRGGCPV